ncbi:MAG: hypothetical protein VW713_07170 [Alphaproteobacteria bacterium]
MNDLIQHGPEFLAFTEACIDLDRATAKRFGCCPRVRKCEVHLFVTQLDNSGKFEELGNWPDLLEMVQDLLRDMRVKVQA